MSWLQLLALLCTSQVALAEYLGFLSFSFLICEMGQ
jgi:hypothetical protein